MAHGKLGTAATAAVDTLITVYTAPTTCLLAEVDIIVSNTNDTQAVVSIAISDQATTPAVSEYIESATVVAAKGVLTLNNVKLSPGEKVFAKASLAAVNVRVQGSEKTTR